MKTGRFINCLSKQNILQYLGTPDFHTLLNKQNMQTVWNMTNSGANTFPDDLAITNTIITPDFDGSRVIYANDTVIVKFEPNDLTPYLQPNELAILLDRANQTNQLTTRMEMYQGKNGFENKNPLPTVNI